MHPPDDAASRTNRPRPATTVLRSILGADEPLELDRRLLIATRYHDVAPTFGGPAAMAAWFPHLRRIALGGDVVEIRAGTAVLRGREQWSASPLGLTFWAPDQALNGFLTVREIILGSPVGFGTEIVLHIQAPNNRASRRHLRTLQQVINRGFAHMRAELSR